MDTNKIVKLFNEEGKTLKEIAEIVNSSKSTVQRKLIADGYQYNRKSCKYEINVSRETIDIENNVDNETLNAVNNVSRETIDIENNVDNETTDIVNRTYGIPSDIDRALKIKCAIEGKKAVDVVRESIKNAIEPKYFNFR